MRPEQRRAIEAAYLSGDTLAGIARQAGVTETEADIYLNWWCDRACPPPSEGATTP